MPPRRRSNPSGSAPTRREARCLSPAPSASQQTTRTPARGGFSATPGRPSLARLLPGVRWCAAPGSELSCGTLLPPFATGLRLKVLVLLAIVGALHLLLLGRHGAADTLKGTRVQDGFRLGRARVLAAVGGRIDQPRDDEREECCDRDERDRKSTRLNSSHGYISY